MTKVQIWDIFWMSKIIKHSWKIKWRNRFEIECLNCWNHINKNIDDLRRKDRPRTCWKCKFYNWESREIKEWTIIEWYTFIKEIDSISWNRRIIVKDFSWEEKNVSYNSFIKWKLKKEINPITKHWMNNTRFYKIYRSILDRCNNKNIEHYDKYWWRWIQCLWNNFDDFKNDMYLSYLEHSLIEWEKNTTIDRIDVNWNYNKANCRWATRWEQVNNRRNNIKIPDEFKWKTLMEICNKYWVNRRTFYSRFNTWYSFKESLWIN